MNGPGEFICRVSRQVSLGTNYYLIELEAPVLAQTVSPGQFAMLCCGEGFDPFLRRPLSIHQVNKHLGLVSFLYKVRGKGMSWLSRRQSGDQVSLLGPLGRGFNCSKPGSKGLLVGAGVGVAPLLFLASELVDRGWELFILMGGRSESGILRPDTFMEYGEVKIATEDGTGGIQGSILELLADELEKSSFDRLFSCGPVAVLKGVQGMSKEKGIPAELSLDEWMACGVGACMGCVCQSADGSYLRVCREGPVFEAGEVVLSG